LNTKRLKNGNSKLKGILIFDLPAVKSCLNSSSCEKTCYAMKAQRMYTTVRNWREANLDLAENNLGLLKDLLISQLELEATKNKNKVVRIHSSGDFISQEYIDMWSFVIAKNPDVKFYAYTKVDKILDFAEIQKLDNFNLIPSMIQGKFLNFGTQSYVDTIVSKYNAFSCPAVQKGSTVKCGTNLENGECDYCIHSKNVVFLIH